MLHASMDGIRKAPQHKEDHVKIGLGIVVVLMVPRRNGTVGGQKLGFLIETEVVELTQQDDIIC